MWWLRLRPPNQLCLNYGSNTKPNQLPHVSTRDCTKEASVEATRPHGGERGKPAEEVKELTWQICRWGRLAHDASPPVRLAARPAPTQKDKAALGRSRDGAKACNLCFPPLQSPGPFASNVQNN